MVNIREYYDSGDGVMKPGKKVCSSMTLDLREMQLEGLSHEGRVELMTKSGHKSPTRAVRDTDTEFAGYGDSTDGGG